MAEKRRIQEPPIRIKPASRATAERIAETTGLNYIQVIEHALDATGAYFDHHGQRLLLPLRFNETFFVYQTPAPSLPNQSKRIRATVVTDAAGLILDVDSAFTEMCGYTLDELRGKKPGDVLQGPATERDIVREFGQAIRQKRSFECTITNYHKNGSTYRVHIKCDPIFDAPGRLATYRAIETLVESSALPRNFITNPLTVAEQGKLQAAHQRTLTAPKKKRRGSNIESKK